jgi:hypothetical protein
MSSTATAPQRSPQQSYEEPIFVKYSPHHEFPLSTVTSIALHALVIGLLIIGGILIAKLNWGGDVKPLPADALVMAGGGGGNPNGVGKGPGDGSLNSDPDAPDAPLDADPDQPPVPAPPREKLQDVRKQEMQLPEFNKDEEGKRLIEKGGPEVDKILRVNKGLRDNLNKPLAGKGKGGSGSGGGEETGTGTGKGGKTGPGTGEGDREKRTLRWTLIFNTRDGQDYMRQLQSCGAIIGVPGQNGDPNSYTVIRDLNRPNPQKEDTVGRIYWVDDGQVSVRSLATALGVPPPAYFLVFFSPEFEEKLLRLEFGFRGKKENEIIETRFDIRRRGDTYEPVVISQR